MRESRNESLTDIVRSENARLPPFSQILRETDHNPPQESTGVPKIIQERKINRYPLPIQPSHFELPRMMIFFCFTEDKPSSQRKE